MPAWPGEGRPAAGAAIAECPAGPAVAAACRALTVQYPDRDRPAVRDIDLVVGRGERVLLMGPSGCGKSTLAYALAGLIPDIIEATVRGELVKPARAGVLFQDPEAQFCLFTVEDEVAFSLENRRLPPEEMPPRIAAALAAAGLEVPWDRPLRELSGGMKQRLALATILALEPDVLFLDEPTAQLDPAGAVRVMDAIRQASTGRSVVIIEHNLDFVVDWVDRAVLLRPDGTLLADGTPASVLGRHERELERFGIWRPRSWGPFWAGRVRSGCPERPAVAPSPEESAEPVTPRGSSGGPAALAPATPEPAGGERGPHAGGDEAGVVPEPLVELRRVAAGYDGRIVWRDVDVTVRRGEWIAVLGVNGSGKTTFLQVLAGLQRPVAGEVRHAPALMAHHGRPPAIGFVFQNPEHQFVTDTVYDEVALAARLEGLPEAEVRRRAEDLLRQFGLEALSAAHPYTLSQGQKRRLSVASMLAVPRHLLILDEPTFGQDARTAAALVQRLAGLHRQGVTIVMTTHDLELAAATATRVLVFGQGRLLYDGEPEEFLRDPARLAEAGLAPIAPTTVAPTAIAPTTAQQSVARGSGLAASPGTPSPAGVGPSGHDPYGRYGSSPRRAARRASRPPLAGVNPAWKLIIHLVALAGVVAVGDPAVLAAMLAVPVLLGWGLGGIGPVAWIRGLAPFVLIAATSAWTLAAYGAGETVIARIGWYRITAEGLARGLEVGLRMLNFGAFGLLFARTTDVVELVLSLIQQLRVSPRWAYGALAALRFLPLLRDEMAQIQTAYGVRGLSRLRGPRGRWEAFKRYSMALLVHAVRQAERVAVALQARGFDGSRDRTYYRRMEAGWREAAYGAGVLTLLALAGWFGRWLAVAWGR